MSLLKPLGISFARFRASIHWFWAWATVFYLSYRVVPSFASFFFKFDDLLHGGVATLPARRHLPCSRQQNSKWTKKYERKRGEKKASAHATMHAVAAPFHPPATRWTPLQFEGGPNAFSSFILTIFNEWNRGLAASRWCPEWCRFFLPILRISWSFLDTRANTSLVTNLYWIISRCCLFFLIFNESNFHLLSFSSFMDFWSFTGFRRAPF